MATDDEQQPDGASSDASTTVPSDASTRPPGGPVERQVRAYRTPRYAVFLATGAVLGLVVGVAIALYGGGDEPTGSTTEAGVLGYFVAFGTLTGALLAGALAVVVESVLNRGRRGRARPARRRPPGGTPPR